MINLKESLPQFNIDCIGVIHVGGFKAEEYDAYKEANLINQMWVEANPQFFYQILEKIKDDDKCIAYNYAIYDEEKEIEFGLANNGASSSILPLKKHLEYYPYIKYDGYLTLKTKRLDNLIYENNIDLKKYDGLVMDVQGVELNILKSLGDLLNNFKFVQSEVNIEELYEGCCLIDDLDGYLSKYGFERKTTVLWDSGSVGWGDALYIKR